MEIRVIEERCRCMEASLCVLVARRFVKFLVYGAVAARNSLFRPWQTVLPRESFTGMKFDCKKDLSTTSRLPESQKKGSVKIQER